MRSVVPLLVLVATACDPSFDHPDAQPLGVSCLELSKPMGLDFRTCQAGDTIVVGDELAIDAGPKVDVVITCAGVPCSMEHGTEPLAAGSLMIHVSLQSQVNSDHNEIDLPTLNVRALDRIDVACTGCTGVKTGDAVEVTATAILDGAPHSLLGNDVVEHSVDPFGFPAKGAADGAQLTWSWSNVQPGTYTMSLTAGGVTVTPSFTVP